MQPDAPEPANIEERFDHEASDPATSSSGMSGASQQPGKSLRVAADPSLEQSKRGPARPDSATAVTPQAPVDIQVDHHPCSIFNLENCGTSQEGILSQKRSSAHEARLECRLSQFGMQHAWRISCMTMPEHLM